MVNNELAIIKGVLSEIIMRCKILRSQIDTKSIEDINKEIDKLSQELNTCKGVF